MLPAQASGIQGLTTVPWRILASNGAMAAVGNLAQVGILVVAYRAWLTLHGAEVTDRWLILVAIANLGALAEVGMSGAALQRLANLTGRERAAWYQGSSRFLVIGSVAAFAVTAVVAWLWMRGRASSSEAIVTAVFTGTVSVGLIWSGYRAGLLKSELRFGVAATVLVGQQAALFLLPCAVAGVGLPVAAGAAAAGLAVVAGVASFAIPAASAKGCLNPHWRTLMNTGFPYAVQNSLAFFFSHFQRLAIASIASPGDIVALAAVQSLLGKAQGLVGGASEALNPAVARGLISPSIYWRAIIISVLVCVVIFLLLSFLAHHWIQLLLPGSVGDNARSIFPLMACGYAAATASAVVAHILFGMGRPWGVVVCGVVAAVVSLVILCGGYLVGYPPLMVAASASSVSFVGYAVAMILHGAVIIGAVRNAPIRGA